MAEPMTDEQRAEIHALAVRARDSNREAVASALFTVLAENERLARRLAGMMDQWLRTWALDCIEQKGDYRYHPAQMIEVAQRVLEGQKAAKTGNN